MRPHVLLENVERNYEKWDPEDGTCAELTETGDWKRAEKDRPLVSGQ